MMGCEWSKREPEGRYPKSEEDWDAWKRVVKAIDSIDDELPCILDTSNLWMKHIHLLDAVLNEDGTIKDEYRKAFVERCGMISLRMARQFRENLLRKWGGEARLRRLEALGSRLLPPVEQRPQQPALVTDPLLQDK
ncbi:unnamed protein product [Vitrella brassicaformis CCMP3155]|uniref:Uncharacterized protein n=2 Tax=Vitrella brassicaformis TaxID=1169539 RepID=A0A0G4EPG5_VITBC|nr:unnamed protein product [Vitrella brassicaformis CCMP3155]|eukprot:CEL99717.1 unnamed protein product [Vitrella brassicaformis CCMP3155]